MRSREATRARTQTPPTPKCHRRGASPCCAPTSSPTVRRLPPAKPRRSQRWRQSRQRGSRLLPALPAAAARAGAARRPLGWGTWSGTAACSAGSYAARRRRSRCVGISPGFRFGLAPWRSRVFELCDCFVCFGLRNVHVYPKSQCLTAYSSKFAAGHNNFCSG